MSKKNVAMGFLSGAAMGAVTALLFAPQKGKFLRSEIRRRSLQTADNVNDFVRVLASRGKQSLQKLVHETTKHK